MRDIDGEAAVILAMMRGSLEHRNASVRERTSINQRAHGTTYHTTIIHLLHLAALSLTCVRLVKRTKKASLAQSSF